MLQMAQASEASHVALVVEDEPLLRMIAADTLRDAGFAVIEAGEAETALELLRTTPDIRLLLTDVQMPGRLDGIDLTLLVKARFPEVRIIITSGSSHRNPRLPGVPFLPKPFRPSALVELARSEMVLV